MNRFWSDVTRQLTPYVPGEQPTGDNLVKLNTNENPYPPCAGVFSVLNNMTGDALRRYPDPDASEIKAIIAGRNGLRMSQVFVGNGSDEVLAHTFQALLRHELPLYFPDVTYSFYPVWCDLYGIDFRQIEVDGELSIDADLYPAENGGIIIPNPNAPTGRLLPLQALRGLLRRCHESVLVVDEAYIDFGGESAVSLIPEFDNLLVIQTLSKSRSLAGLRVGFAMGHSKLIEALERVKNSFNSYPLGTIAQAAAVAALEDEPHLQTNCQRIIKTREELSVELNGLGFDVLPSSANFVFVTHRHRPASEIFHALRERGVIVRYFDRPRIDNYLRISIGSDADCAALLAALRAIVQ